MVGRSGCVASRTTRGNSMISFGLKDLVESHVASKSRTHKNFISLSDMILTSGMNEPWRRSRKIKTVAILVIGDSF